jgi:hypothetical protein
MGSSASTGVGGSGGAPIPEPFTFGNSKCKGTWSDIAPANGFKVNGKTISEYGAISAILALPPGYPASYDSIKVPLIANAPLNFCNSDKQHTTVVVYVGKIDGTTTHPDAAHTRVVDVDPSTLTWGMTAGGSDLAEPVVKLVPPLVANEGEALWGGPSLTDDGDGYICTRFCTNDDGSSEHDPYSWWTSPNAMGTEGDCPTIGCEFVPLWQSPSETIAAGNGVHAMRNAAEVTGIAPPGAKPFVLVPSGSSFSVPVAAIWNKYRVLNHYAGTDSAARILTGSSSGSVCPDGSAPPCAPAIPPDSQ